MSARSAVLTYLGETISGHITTNTDYEIIAWVGAGDALIVDDSNHLYHISSVTDTGTWAIVRV